jgi:glycosyltransferase involved in cell wall biosynthesis
LAAIVMSASTIWEGFGLIVSETLGKQAPLGCRQYGGFPMPMPDGAGGYRVDAQDEERFTDRVVSLLTGYARTQMLSERGHAAVRDRSLITRLVVDELTLLIECADR